ncbi:MAG: GGDEF domain-containing protein [Planctomycetota bacterium]
MNTISLWGGGFGLPETVALAAVAAIGYLFGRRQKTQPTGPEVPSELLRAMQIAKQLEQVAKRLRGDLASHHAEVERFKTAVREAAVEGNDETLRLIQEESDRVLAPTLRLVTQVANAYDQIRRQSHALSDFSGGRTDKLTGLYNIRALSELLQIELAGHAATGGRFSIAIFGLHGSADGSESSRNEQQTQLLHAAELLRGELRDTDLVARYGIDELVVVMPHTRLYGAGVFGRRVRATLGEAGITVSCGLTQTMPEDTPGALLGRADSALYSAKASGDGAQFLHNGQAIRADLPPEERLVVAEEAEPLADETAAELAAALD